MPLFDYLENVAFAATVCDHDGVVLYQNAVARERDGAVVGQNLFDCHTPQTGEKIRALMSTGTPNTYEVTHHGRRSLVHHTPWYAHPNGPVSGLIELEINLPNT